MIYSAVMSESENQALINHLIRADGQEDLCFALYAPSTGSNRFSGVIKEIILPSNFERNIHGNVSFNSMYFDRVTSLALQKELGICFIHSHPVPGWQKMSRDDIDAESGLAPRVKAITNLPLLGMTLGLDGTWSARFWVKNAIKEYNRHWCHSVRIVGKGLKINYCDDLMPPPLQIEEFTRTLSAWGKHKQADIERLKVGIVGVGSVGSIVSEALVKTGVQDITLIDFDRIKRRNIDRLQFVSANDIGRLKIEKYKEILLKSAPRDSININVLPYSISEELGLKGALDCDVIFSCVDRPLPRYILNSLSYANLIPVIDGGIDASINKTKTNIGQARWRAFTICPHRRCLKCHQQFNEQDVGLEMEGLLDDPVYVTGMSEGHHLLRGENVFAFSLSLASMLMQQFLSLVLQPKGVYYGGKEMDFTTGNIDAFFSFKCETFCDTSDLICIGDKINNELIIPSLIAEESRSIIGFKTER